MGKTSRLASLNIYIYLLILGFEKFPFHFFASAYICHGRNENKFMEIHMVNPCVADVWFFSSFHKSPVHELNLYMNHAVHIIVPRIPIGIQYTKFSEGTQEDKL